MPAPNKDAATAHLAGHRTVSRVMTILELVVDNEPSGLRLADLAQIMGAPKSSIHGLARGLVATGYLREENGRYFQGAALSGLLGIGGQQVPAIYLRTLEQLSRRWNETSVLATLASDSVINLSAIEPDQMVRASPPLHQRRPMWPGSYGKCFLAFMEPARLKSYLGQHHPDPDEQSRILEELDEVRRTRVAINRGGIDAQLFGIASPIFLAGSETTRLAIGLAVPMNRVPRSLDEMADSIRKAAATLSYRAVNETHAS